MRLGDSSSSSRCYGLHTPSTQDFVHPNVSPSSTATPSATPHDTMSPLALVEGQTWWHPAKDATRALKDCVRRLYTHAYHSWSKIPNSIL
ncbi:hypothetical protein H5410_003623 [Solanum commersonii]|uniref:Uncharacterized protein n=1 Tax=Solanum commersonii TaxID=4109 RepID=A0A9J6B5M0_SOLCO|nr:hypothetical protein H5410_003623 [Solanum commersonii]